MRYTFAVELSAESSSQHAWCAEQNLHNTKHKQDGVNGKPRQNTTKQRPNHITLAKTTSHSRPTPSETQSLNSPHCSLDSRVACRQVFKCIRSSPATTNRINNVWVENFRTGNEKALDRAVRIPISFQATSRNTKKNMSRIPLPSDRVIIMLSFHFTYIRCQNNPCLAHPSTKPYNLLHPTIFLSETYISQASSVLREKRRNE